MHVERGTVELFIHSFIHEQSFIYLTAKVGQALC